MKRSRRELFGTFWRLLVAAPALRCFAGPALSIDQVRDPGCEFTGNQSKTYRADVVVSLMGVPLLSRLNAGSAYASLHERADGPNRTVALSFAGGADPKRTHGISYLGSFEEIAIESDMGLAQAATFGFVTTSSSEESFSDARRRFANGNAVESRFVVVDELHRASSVRIRKTFVPSANVSCREIPRLRREVRAEFLGANTTERELSTPHETVPATFLRTMLAAARCPERQSSHEYLHNGTRYALLCEKTTDTTAGCERVRLTGRVRDLETRKTSTFRLWFIPGSDLPEKIEFSPRAYLRITLESETVQTEEGL